jgi:molybdopterin-biosynthesis enzyme MoeA-like protein
MTSTTPTFGLIIIGDEIMSGKRQDKHMPKVIELMSARGLTLSWADYVGDSPERITATLQRALASADVVFSCGGIGATPDDHTRQCAARALGVPLALHPQAKLLIQERMQDTAKEQGTAYEPDRPDNIHRLNMGVFPEGATIIRNPYNKIPGFSCQGAGGGAVHFVPGFPVMAWPMIESVLDTQYSAHFCQNAYVEKSVVILGAMEATLTPADGSHRSRAPRRQGVQLAQCGSPAVGPPHRIGGQGRARPCRRGLRRLATGAECVPAEIWP